MTLRVALERGLGTDRLRSRAVAELAPRPGETVLDVGCGPAYHLELLPGVRYIGYDIDHRAIAYARSRWGGRGEFRCETLTADHVPDLPQLDAVLLVGVLHHLDDKECANLLDICSMALAATGRVIGLDPCSVPGRGRWQQRLSRAAHVRAPHALVDLARPAFADVDGDVLTGITRVPSSFWLMRMRTPVR